MSGGAKSEGDEPVHHIDAIPGSLLSSLRKPSSNAAPSSRVLLKTIARNITNSFDKHNKDLLSKKGNGPTRLFRMIIVRRLMLQYPERDWSKFAALDNFHADVLSPSDNSPLHITLTLDKACLECIGATLPGLQDDLQERNFYVHGRTLPLLELNHKAVHEALAKGKFSMTFSHELITEQAHLQISHISTIACNSNTNPGEIRRSSVEFNRAQPKLCIVKTQKLLQAEAKEKGKEIEVTEHETITSTKIKRTEYVTKVNKAVVNFQKNEFKEITEKINRNITITVKLVPWNYFDDLGRSPHDRYYDKRIADNKKRKAKTDVDESSEDEWADSDDE